LAESNNAVAECRTNSFCYGKLDTITVTHWLVVSTILKNIKANWKDDIPYIMENEIHVPNHQPAHL